MRQGFSTRDLAAAAMGTALIAVCAWLSIPTTVPFTMQTFAVCFLAGLFGQTGKSRCPQSGPDEDQAQYPCAFRKPVFQSSSVYHGVPSP